MARAAWLKIPVITAMSVVLAGTPSALAQRGGGFHGSGFGGMHSPGFGGFHGQGFGGFHGGGFGGFQPGFGGFHGGFGGPSWGFPGWGWGFNIGFGFGPYWGGYPYFWGSSPWSGPYGYYPPYDAYYAPDDRDDSNRDYRDGYDYRYDPEFRRPPANAPKPNDSDDNSPQKPSSSAELPAQAENQLALNFADYRPAVSDETEQTVRAALHSPLRNPQDGSTLPRAVKNVIEALRAMPPAARLRQLSSGRYNGFSPEERELLRNEFPVFKAE